MLKNPRRGRQARNCTENVPKIVPKILDLKSSSEQIFPKIEVGCPWERLDCVASPNRYFTENSRRVPLCSELTSLHVSWNELS